MNFICEFGGLKNKRRGKIFFLEVNTTKLFINYPLSIWRELHRDVSEIRPKRILQFVTFIDLQKYFNPTNMKCFNNGDYEKSITLFCQSAPDYLLSAIEKIAIERIVRWPQGAAESSQRISKLQRSFFQLLNSISLDQLLALEQQTIDFFVAQLESGYFGCFQMPVTNRLLLLNILTLQELNQFRAFPDNIQNSIVGGLASHFNYDDSRVLYHRLFKFGFEKLSVQVLSILFEDVEVLIAASDMDEALFFDDLLPQLILMQSISAENILQLLEKISTTNCVGNQRENVALSLLPPGTASQLRLHGIAVTQSVDCENAQELQQNSAEQEKELYRNKAPAAS